MTFQTETLDRFMDVEPAAQPRAGQSFVVVHPLYDEPEAKCSADHLGPLRLTRGCRVALVAVRCYLAAIMLMGAYRVVEFIRH
jgi:hypothetical protein